MECPVQSPLRRDCPCNDQGTLYPHEITNCTPTPPHPQLPVCCCVCWKLASKTPPTNVSPLCAVYIVNSMCCISHLTCPPVLLPPIHVPPSSPFFHLTHPPHTQSHAPFNFHRFQSPVISIHITSYHVLTCCFFFNLMKVCPIYLKEKEIKLPHHWDFSISTYVS